jgi:hypothetical protein
MKTNRKFKEAKEFGLEIKVNKDLDKYSEMNLFPEKLENANKILINMKFAHIKIR